MPPVPGPGLVVIEAQLVLCGLKAILNGPALPFDLDQRLDGRSNRTPSGEERHLSVGDVAADQQAARPKTGERGCVFGDVEICQVAVRPIVQAWTLRAFTSRQALPARSVERGRDLFRCAANSRIALPGVEAMSSN